MAKVDSYATQTYEFKQRTRSLFKFQEAYEVTNPETKQKLFWKKRSFMAEERFNSISRRE